MADQERPLADLVAARSRMARASDAWLEADEGDGLTDEIVAEYHAAYTALVDLNDAQLFRALERTDG